MSDDAVTLFLITQTPRLVVSMLSKRTFKVTPSLHSGATTLGIWVL